MMRFYLVLKILKNLYIEGRGKNLEFLANKYFKGELESVIFPNLVFVSGEYNGEIVSNGDEWDSYSFAGQL